MKTPKRAPSRERHHPYPGATKPKGFKPSSTPGLSMAFLKTTLSNGNLFTRRKSAKQDSAALVREVTGHIESPKVLTDAFRLELNKEIDEDMRSVLKTPITNGYHSNKTGCHAKVISNHGNIVHCHDKRMTGPLLADTPDRVMSVCNKVFGAKNTPTGRKPSKLSRLRTFRKHFGKKKQCIEKSSGRNLYQELQIEKLEAQLRIAACADIQASQSLDNQSAHQNSTTCKRLDNRSASRTPHTTDKAVGSMACDTTPAPNRCAVVRNNRVTTLAVGTGLAGPVVQEVVTPCSGRVTLVQTVVPSRDSVRPSATSPSHSEAVPSFPDSLPHSPSCSNLLESDIYSLDESILGMEESILGTPESYGPTPRTGCHRQAVNRQNSPPGGASGPQSRSDGQCVEGKKGSTDNIRKFWATLALNPDLNPSMQQSNPSLGNTRNRSVSGENSGVQLCDTETEVSILGGVLVADQAQKASCHCPEDQTQHTTPIMRHWSRTSRLVTTSQMRPVQRERTHTTHRDRTGRLVTTVKRAAAPHLVTPVSKRPCTPVRSVSPTGDCQDLSPIAPLAQSPLSPVLLPMCCRWAQDRRQRMKATQEVLESTRISEKAPDGVHGRTSTLSLPSVPEAGLPSAASLPRAPQAPHPDLLEATLDLDQCPDSELDQEPDSGLDQGPDSGVDQYPDSGLDVGPDPGLDPADHMAILEYGDRDQSFTWPGEPSHTDKVTQAYKGQLKLSVYVNSGLLTVHIMQARHLVSKYSSTCNTYVKVGVIPDDYCNIRSKTMLVKGSNNPVYDEKFSFELMPEDLAKRVFVCVCHRDRKRPSAELLGCMSFGINNVRKKKKDVSGWFYLLAEPVGKRKHLQVAPYYHDNTHLNKVNDPGSSPWEPQEASKNIRVSLERGKRGGYGFSLTGGCPAVVCRVDPGGPAHIAGTRTGDYLLRVNGENVSTANSDCAGRIIRHSSSRVALEFLRPGAFGGDPTSSLWQPGYQDLDSSTDSEASFASEGHSPPRSAYWEDKENLGPRLPREGAKRVRFQEFQ